MASAHPVSAGAVFTSDNSPENDAFERLRRYGHWSSQPLRGLKRDLWEGGHRVPFLVRWPGVVCANEVSDALTSQVDLMATFAAAAGAALPAGAAEDSHDLLAVWKDGAPSPRRSIVLIAAKSGNVNPVPAWFDAQRGYTPHNQPGELYNLERDLAQRHNLYARLPDKVAELERLLARTRARGGGAVTLPGASAIPMIRKFLLPLILTAGLGVAAQSRPNILFIMSDDHAAHAIGAYGGRLAALDPTPTLDRLAREGMRMQNVFCTNGICTPSRATLMTGQYPHRNGITTLVGSLPPSRQTLALLMRQAGYETAVIGKWHLEAEPAAFDYYCVFPSQGLYHNPVLHRKGRGEWPDNEVKYPLPRRGYSAVHSSDVITNLAIEWLGSRRGDKPFFLMHHFKAPHDNFENAERYDFLYEDVEIPEPESLRRVPNYGSEATRGMGTSIGKRNKRRNMGMHMHVDPSLPDAEYLRVSYQRYLKKYLRCVRGVDDNVARLLDHLRQTGELDNTIVIYTSDQGFMLGEHDYIDKRWMYEETLRMPFIMRYPSMIAPGSVSDAVINNVDFAPTLLDLAGVAAPDTMQGRSFRPILEGHIPPDWPEATYYRYWMHMAHHDNPAHYGIRTKDFKLIFFYGLPLDARGAEPEPTTPGWELYDLRKDPHELSNMYDDPAYAETARALKSQLLKLKERIGDTDEKYPELMKVRAARWE